MGRYWATRRASGGDTGGKPLVANAFLDPENSIDQAINVIWVPSLNHPAQMRIQWYEVSGGGTPFLVDDTGLPGATYSDLQQQSSTSAAGVTYFAVLSATGYESFTTAKQTIVA